MVARLGSLTSSPPLSSKMWSKISMTMAAEGAVAEEGVQKAPQQPTEEEEEGAQEGDQTTVLPPREHVRTNATRAAREEGADKKAAAAGGQCAATVGLTDVTLHLLQDRSDFDPPAEELDWKDRDRTHLVMTPEASEPIEHLKQELDQAEGAVKAEAHCMQLGNQMEARFIADEDLDITPL